MRDLRDAGKLALSVGRQLRDQKSARRIIRSDLKSMTDMMFGPLVHHVGLRYDRDIFVEICALIALLMSNLEGHGSVRNLVRRFVFMLSTSLVVFMGTLGLRF